jgi:hypothetical protein
MMKRVMLAVEVETDETLAELKVLVREQLAPVVKSVVQVQANLIKPVGKRRKA